MIQRAFNLYINWHVALQSPVRASIFTFIVVGLFTICKRRICAERLSE